MAAVGVSTSTTCGVRDHATLLAEALSRENVSCSVHWLYRSEVDDPRDAVGDPVVDASTRR